MYSVESIGAPRGYVPVMLGNALGQTQTVSTREIATELTARGYRVQTAAPVTAPVTAPITTTTTPAITRTEAIKKAVDYSLRLYGLATRCTKLGGCALTQSRFNAILDRAARLATGYLQAAAVTARSPSISPAVSPSYTYLRGAVSPRLSGIGSTLYGLGQTPIIPGFQPTPPPLPQQPAQLQPEMTTWDWVAIISNAAQGVASTVEAYANARAQRERAGLTATLTADQVKTIVNEAMIQNPTLNRAQLIAAAAGATGDEEPKGMPGWVIPVLVGVGVVAVMPMFRGRK